MADDGEIYHETPDGESVADRLRMYDYPQRGKADGQRFCHACGSDLRPLVSPHHCPDCGDTLDTARRSSTVGENLASRTQFGPRARLPEPDELADGIVEGWLDSPGHRRNLLDDHFDREAIGVVIREGAAVRVYVTQVFS